MHFPDLARRRRQPLLELEDLPRERVGLLTHTGTRQLQREGRGLLVRWCCQRRAHWCEEHRITPRTEQSLGFHVGASSSRFLAVRLGYRRRQRSRLGSPQRDPRSQEGIARPPRRLCAERRRSNPSCRHLCRPRSQRNIAMERRLLTAGKYDLARAHAVAWHWLHNYPKMSGADCAALKYGKRHPRRTE
jgi:hypothetical protein